jgi:hypothetical protein
MFTYGIVDLPFQIVMGEVPVPVAEIYHPVEGERRIRFLFSY